MAKVMYFVIGVDVDNGTKFIDDDTLQARFWDGLTILDNETMEWESENDPEMDTYPMYRKALEILNDKDVSLDG